MVANEDDSWNRGAVQPVAVLGRWRQARASKWLIVPRVIVGVEGEDGVTGEKGKVRREWPDSRVIVHLTVGNGQPHLLPVLLRALLPTLAARVCHSDIVRSYRSRQGAQFLRRRLSRKVQLGPVPPILNDALRFKSSLAKAQATAMRHLDKLATQAMAF